MTKKAILIKDLTWKQLEDGITWQAKRGPWTYLAYHFYDWPYTKYRGSVEHPELPPFQTKRSTLEKAEQFCQDHDSVMQVLASAEQARRS